MIRMEHNPADAGMPLLYAAVLSVFLLSCSFSNPPHPRPVTEVGVLLASAPYLLSLFCFFQSRSV